MCGHVGKGRRTCGGRVSRWSGEGRSLMLGVGGAGLGNPFAPGARVCILWGMIVRKLGGVGRSLPPAFGEKEVAGRFFRSGFLGVGAQGIWRVGGGTK